ncbi:MAG: methyltransferase domain-containing protein [Thermomicrobiales bacterium]
MTGQQHLPSDPSREAYTLRDNPAFDAELAQRTATREAAFFLPHLHPGMRLLDVGCGPGSITLGLAAVIAPGEVVGIDLRPEPLEQARMAANERGIANVRFEAGSAYELPFPDGSFDAVFASVTLMHLREPVRALEEVRRVLRPGGMVGVRDPDFDSIIVFPLMPLWEQFYDLRGRVLRHNGANQFVGRTHRRLLMDAGFARTEAGATADAAGTPAETRRIAAFHVAQMEGLARTALTEGWADQETLDAMRADFDAWVARPDAFYARVICHAVGWVGG